MKKTRWYTGLIALSAAGALVLTGCSGGGDSTGEGGADSVVTTNGTNPANPLIPTATNEVGGGKIIDLMFAGLVYYDAEGAAHNDLAESIESDDQTNYTVKIRDDAKFTDGTPVKAENFVKAWNYGAALDNAQLNSYFFEDIKGFSYDEHVEELPGLKVVDDTTFTVELNQPTSDFPTRLGYSAYYPLPDVAFDDMEAFGKEPIGNGPYLLESITPDTEAKLVKNDDYNGPREAQNGGVTIKFYAQLEAAYSDLQAGNLDILDQVPDSVFKTYESDFEDTSVNQPSAVFQSFTIPERLDHFGNDEEGKLRRQAISMAIDRDTITDKIFEGTRTPAKDFTSPVIDGWTEDIPGNEVLEYNPDEAKKLWAQANEISEWDGTFQIAYNADASHQAWVDATANSIKNVLEIDASGAPIPVFDEFRNQIVDRSIETAFRTGWQADYPGLFNFLGPLYGTKAGSNDGDYSNTAFDTLLKEGNSEADIDAANEKYIEAQEILMQDLPAIPLWYANVNGAWNDSVENVEYGWNSVPLYHEVTKN